MSPTKIKQSLRFLSVGRVVEQLDARVLRGSWLERTEGKTDADGNHR